MNEYLCSSEISIYKETEKKKIMWVIQLIPNLITVAISAPLQQNTPVNICSFKPLLYTAPSDANQLIMRYQTSTQVIQSTKNTHTHSADDPCTQSGMCVCCLMAFSRWILRLFKRASIDVKAIWEAGQTDGVGDDWWGLSGSEEGLTSRPAPPTYK